MHIRGRVGPRVGSGRVGSDFLLEIAGRVGSGQRFVGSGRVGSKKSDPWTTLVHHTCIFNVITNEWILKSCTLECTARLMKLLRADTAWQSWPIEICRAFVEGATQDSEYYQISLNKINILSSLFWSKRHFIRKNTIYTWWTGNKRPSSTILSAIFDPTVSFLYNQRHANISRTWHFIEFVTGRKLISINEILFTSCSDMVFIFPPSTRGPAYYK